MKGPGIFEYVLLILASLLFALAGLYMLARFSQLFRRSIRPEWLRKNVAAWIIILCISVATSPMSGGFFYLLEKNGWWGTIVAQLVSATACTLFIYNPVLWVIQRPAIRRLSFFAQTTIIVVVLILTTVAVNIPLTYWMYSEERESFMKYIISNSIYIAGATGLVYGVTRYLDIERKRKFDQKELELSRLRELKTKAELDALHSKINPHFLYNALNSIADLSVTDGKKARKMTVALADLFRYSINYSDHNYASVQDEVEMAEVYLQIEKIRFEDQLNYSVSVDKELYHYLLPRFILQPVVENAVKHGLKATGRMTEIQIDVRRGERGIELLVTDNGPAFPDELVPGYGVKSIYDKLDLLFPGQYEVHFTNQPLKQVHIYIHKLMKDEPAVQSDRH